MDDVGLISREELTAYLFTVQDMHRDLHAILELLGGGDDDGEAPEADS